MSIQLYLWPTVIVFAVYVYHYLDTAKPPFKTITLSEIDKTDLKVVYIQDRKLLLVQYQNGTVYNFYSEIFGFNQKIFIENRWFWLHILYDADNEAYEYFLSEHKICTQSDFIKEYYSHYVLQFTTYQSALDYFPSLNPKKWQKL